MIYTLTLNPCLDYTMHVNEWERGQVNRSQKEVCYVGGKGINVSVVLSNLGNENTALGFIGGFSGRELERLLIEKNIKTDFVQVEGDTRINVKIMCGGETQFNGAGPFVSESAVAELYQKLDTLKSGDYLVMAGSVPSCLSKDFYEDVMERLAGKGVNFVVDSTKELLLNTLKYNPFLIKPNNFELGEMFGVEIKSVEDVFEYGVKLQEKGARNVIVSMGGDGAVLISEKGHKKYLEAPKGKVVDTVGAGDSVVAGFISEFVATSDYERSFMRGVATGSATAFSPELATKSQSDALFEKLLKN